MIHSFLLLLSFPRIWTNKVSPSKLSSIEVVQHQQLHQKEGVGTGASEIINYTHRECATARLYELPGDDDE